MRRWKRTLVGLGIAALLLLAAAGAGAEPGGSGLPRVSPVLGSDIRISGGSATADDENTAAVWNATANEYLIVWQDERDSSTRGSDIYGRRVSATGSPVGGDFRISGPGATADDENPEVAWNATANEYLVVWQDRRNISTRGYDIYGRRVSATGSPVGADFRISGPGATSDDFLPDVVWNGTANQYLVVWADERDSSTRGLDIYARRVSATGSPVGGDVRISHPAATSNETAPTVAWNGTANEYLVAWEDDRDFSTRATDIYGRRVPGTGSPVGADFRISGPAATRYEYGAAVAWNGIANEYLIVWEDFRNSSTRGFDVYGRRVSAAGSLVGGDFRVSGPGATSYDGTAAVAWNATANQYLVVWEDGRNSATRGNDIYGRQVSATGSVVGADFRICGPGATSYDSRPAVAWNGTASEYLVVWQDWRNYSTRGYDIFGRRVAG